MSREYKSVSESMSEGGPAFPGKVMNTSFAGITTRDYFAAQALQGSTGNPDCNHWTREMHAKYAYAAADAMLQARK